MKVKTLIEGFKISLCVILYLVTGRKCCLFFVNYIFSDMDKDNGNIVVDNHNF